MNVQDEIQNTVGRIEHDKAGCKSIYGRLCRIQQHLKNPNKVYPSLQNGIRVIAAVGFWSLGDFAEIIPIGAITNRYNIYAIVIENSNTEDIYELVLFKGAVGEEVEVGRIRFMKSDKKGQGSSTIEFKSKCFDANERISAKIASSLGSNGYVDISIFYNDVLLEEDYEE